MAPDINLLKSISQQNLSTALRLIAGFKKILVIEAKLTQTLDLIANYQFLTNHGVAKVYHLENCCPPHSIDSKESDANTIIYLIHSNLISAKLVCDQINYNLNQQQKKNNTEELKYKYGVIVIPRNLHIISSLFESEGVYGHVVFGQYNYEFLALDDYILSLEYDNIIPDLWLHGDTSYLVPIAKDLFNLRGIYGDFHHFIALGNYSTSIMKIMNEFEYIYQHSLREHFRPVSDLPTIIIMDRAVDFLSPLLLPMTYEGLLDEIFEIKGKTIIFDSTVTGGEDKSKKVKHSLSTDAIFNQIRSTHFSSVVKQLVAVGGDLKRQKDTSSCLPLAAMKSFVEKDLKKIQVLQKSVCLHLGALDVIIKERAAGLKQVMDMESNIFDGVNFKEVVNYLEDSMAKDVDFITILRVFCVASLVQDGLRDYKSLKQQFIQSYGFKQLITLNQLEKMGLVYPHRGVDLRASSVVQALSRVGPTGPGSTGTKSTVPFQAVVRKLIPPTNTEIKLDVPDHPSYIFNGKYTPLVAKVTEEILSTLFHPKTASITSNLLEKKLDDILKFYQITSNCVKLKSTAASPSSTLPDPFSRGRNIFVFIVGGITRGEIAALQLISRKLECNIITGGTNITNGKKMFTNLVTM